MNIRLLKRIRRQTNRRLHYSITPYPYTFQMLIYYYRDGSEKMFFSSVIGEFVNAETEWCVNNIHEAEDLLIRARRCYIRDIIIKLRQKNSFKRSKQRAREWKRQLRKLS